MTFPPGLKAASSDASFSRVVLGRGPSSAAAMRPSGRTTGVISRSKKPFFCASTARSCDRLANSSIRSRVIPYCSATFSAVIPIGMYTWLMKSGLDSSANLGFMSSESNPLPMVREIDSTPAAM